MSLPEQNIAVAILLCTHNGAQFLAEQLDSIARQTHKNWVIWASDDGSTDDTVTILQRYQTAWGLQKLHILAGPGRGSSANFLSLACNGDITADCYSYADQDDIWNDDKLERAVKHLANVQAGQPGLYFSRTHLVDESGHMLGPSRLFTRPPNFLNAMVQNIAAGNTIVFNAAGRDILRYAGPEVDIVVHDWWAYMAITGCGGAVFHDPTPTLKYRQHGGNQIGANRGVLARVIRAGLLLEGRFRYWMDVNMAALATIEAKLTPANRQAYSLFRQARHAPLIPRLIGVIRSGITRQTFLDNLGLYIAAVLNRL